MDVRERGRTPSQPPRVPPRRGEVKRMIFRCIAESIGFSYAESGRPGIGAAKGEHGLGSPAVAAGA
ncbi:hypothetical protein QJS04_geneDACA009208 [Acorus gramineus]|uniref:Uncharacterized protein n=1 Tax=Acorus gramineus TaxID=55184 RepID=A0AAV9AHP3_ACOGR|nr:hypothetical protein QJS04_geneDACA009208 [Acorus gramineus]